MAAAAVDVPQLALFCSIPESTISNLIDAPTSELVTNFLQAVAARAQTYNELEAQKLRLDVELESAVRSGETKARALKSRLEKEQKENAELKSQVDQEGALI